MIKGRSTWFVQIRTSTRALRWRDHAQVLLKSATYVVASYFGAHQLARQQTRTMKTKRMKIVGDDWNRPFKNGRGGYWNGQSH